MIKIFDNVIIIIIDVVDAHHLPAEEKALLIFQKQIVT